MTFNPMFVIISKQNYRSYSTIVKSKVLLNLQRTYFKFNVWWEKRNFINHQDLRCVLLSHPVDHHLDQDPQPKILQMMSDSISNIHHIHHLIYIIRRLIHIWIRTVLIRIILARFIHRLTVTRYLKNRKVPLGSALCYWSFCCCASLALFSIDPCLVILGED